MKQALHPDLKRQLIGGADLLVEVEQVANYLAELMREIHGDEWRVSVNHNTCFVMVARDFSDKARAAE